MLKALKRTRIYRMRRIFSTIKERAKQGYYASEIERDYLDKDQLKHLQKLGYNTRCNGADSSYLKISWRARDAS